jgi:tRNA-dihydrouridine synthase
MNFWQELPQPFSVLAPMEAVTDVVFRKVIAHASSPDVWFTEFTNSTGWLAAGNQAIGTRLIKDKSEKPIVAQLWGTEPEAMSRLAQYCTELRFDGVDLNTGCPDQAAIKSGSGAALIKNPELTTKLINSLKSSNLPVSVKCRLGYSNTDEYKSWVSHLLSHDLAALTVHLRTKKEMSKVPAHWELMPEIIKLRDKISPDTIIIGNGDVESYTHGQRLCEQTGCDGFMIGRGVFNNPYCFTREEQPSNHTREKLMNLLKLHLDLYDKASLEHKGNFRPYDPLKKFFKIYIREFDGAGELRAKLMQTRHTDEAREVLKNFTL